MEKEEIELTVRRTISKEISEYRSHLTSLLNRTTWAIGILTAVFVGGILFFTGRSHTEAKKSMDTLLEDRINQEFIKRGIDNSIVDQVQNRTMITLEEYLKSASFHNELEVSIREVAETVVSSTAMNSLQLAIDNKIRKINSIKLNPKYEVIPVGTVIASVLKPSIFFGTLQGDKKGWALANGQTIQGSKFSLATNRTTVPDMRGLFLRGINVGRKDIYTDKEGERTAGSIQKESIAFHSHAIPGQWQEESDLYSSEELQDGSGINDLLRRGLNSYNSNITASSKNKDNFDAWIERSRDGYTYSFGGKETKPNNVAVYYYIKIN